jgi:hypothetical protein
VPAGCSSRICWPSSLSIRRSEFIFGEGKVMDLAKIFAVGHLFDSPKIFCSALKNIPLFLWEVENFRPFRQDCFQCALGLKTSIS